MELLDLYNQSGEKIGKTIVRGDKNLLKDEFIKLSIVWIKAGDKFLIQKCSKEKGGEFAVTGGHVTSGNTSKQQVILECEEELGLVLNENKLKLLGNIYKEHAIFDIYLYEDINLINFPFKLQEIEVESVCWLSLDEIENLCKENLFRQSSKEQYEKFIKNLYLENEGKL